MKRRKPSLAQAMEKQRQAERYARWASEEGIARFTTSEIDAHLDCIFVEMSHGARLSTALRHAGTTLDLALYAARLALKRVEADPYGGIRADYWRGVIAQLDALRPTTKRAVSA